MTVATSSYQIHTQERGPHWISWITRGGSTKPERSVVIIAANEKEAHERARLWAEQTDY